ncbi:SDR family NAD(P)-dependent oxidoreductase [Qipengyuania sp. S6317L1]|uniref:SDR family NAD(P)-dependent oxidoreductase n=1 Tax=Qipengyuania sp. S6317L1 TaxID=2926410 RepID=UPI001FF47E88|nr:SDR family NAD(P)-dependent oxidoreductase [Qipengyuania sp. S6317L1]MCK0099450.1 SDR family NAD(P)-dependent oxidoreductase [Qipengyuania sp. S6317L1]
MIDTRNEGGSAPQGASAQTPTSAAIFGASGGIGAALVRRLEQLGCAKVYAGSRSGRGDFGANAIPFRFDLEQEASIEEAAAMMREAPPQWVIVASGVLTLEGGSGPERTYKRLDPVVMAKVLSLNTIGPAIIAKHMMRLMPRDEAFAFAALSARVGSIGDNGLGGWHSYRASKAALNMLLKNFAIEMARTHPHGVIAGLHPGTVDTALSNPFQKGLPDGQLTHADEAADNLISVLANLTPDQSGQVYDFAGKLIKP